MTYQTYDWLAQKLSYSLGEGVVDGQYSHHAVQVSLIPEEASQLEGNGLSQFEAWFNDNHGVMVNHLTLDVGSLLLYAEIDIEHPSRD
jgi:hypothetical protein